MIEWMYYTNINPFLNKIYVFLGVTLLTSPPFVLQKNPYQPSTNFTMHPGPASFCGRCLMWISSWHPVIDIVYQVFVGHFGVVASIHTLGFKNEMCKKTSCEGLGKSMDFPTKILYLIIVLS